MDFTLKVRKTSAIFLLKYATMKCDFELVVNDI